MRSLWQIQQGKKCPCGGSDEYCPCQNVEFKDSDIEEAGHNEFTKEPQPGQLLDWMTHHHIPMSIQFTEDGLWEVVDQSEDTVISSAGSVFEALVSAHEILEP